MTVRMAVPVRTVGLSLSSTLIVGVKERGSVAVRSLFRVIRPVDLSMMNGPLVGFLPMKKYSTVLLLQRSASEERSSEIMIVPVEV